MSNLSVNQPHSNPIQPNPRVERDPDVHPVETQRQNLSESQRKSLFDSQRQLGETSTQLHPDDVQRLEAVIDNVGSQTLTNQTHNIPHPNGLNQARGTVDRAQTLPILPQVPQVENFDGSRLRFDDGDLSIARHEFSQALRSSLGKDPAQTLKQKLQPELKTLLKELSQSDKLLTRSNSAQQAINARAKQEMTNLLKKTGRKEDLGQLVSLYSRDELKALVAELVGEEREGKTRTFDQLSPKKQAFVNEVVSGITAGARFGKRSEYGMRPDPQHPDGAPIPKEPTPLAKTQERLLNQLKAQLSLQVGGGQMAQLKFKSDDELRQIFSPFIGSLDTLDHVVIQAVREFVPTAPPRQIEPFVKELTLEDLNGPQVRTSLDRLSQEPGSQTARTAVIQALRDHLQGLPTDHNTLWQLGLKSEPEMHQLLQQLAGFVAPPVYPLAEEDVQALTREIRALLPNRASQETELIEGARVPQRLTLGDKQYRPEGFLAKAGYGSVYAYVNVDDPHDKVAVKILLPNDEQEKIHQDSVRELNLHRELQGRDGHVNVIGLHGAVHGPDDSLCMVMEYAPGGDLFNLGNQLELAVKSGELSPESRQLVGLSLLKQALESVAYLHEDREMLHSDLKSSNLMIGEDGRVKMIDFGTSSLGTTRNIDQRFVDNPIYLAPEQMSNLNTTTQATSKSDIWSIGTLAYELLVGPMKSHPSYNYPQLTDTEVDMRQFMQNVDGRFLDHLPQNANPQTQQIHELINQLMTPSPEQRLSARQALSLPIFQNPRLDSEELRQVVQSIQNHRPKQEEIDSHYQRFVQDRVDQLQLAHPSANRGELETHVRQDLSEEIRKDIKDYLKVSQIQQPLQQLLG